MGCCSSTYGPAQHGSQEEVEKFIADQTRLVQTNFEREKAAMKAIDADTKQGHLLVELRNLGFVEIQGKDVGGIYARLQKWFRHTWVLRDTDKDLVLQAMEEKLTFGGGWLVCIGVDTRLDFNEVCDASFATGPMGADGRPSYASDIFLSRGDRGENNMGKLTMQLVDFMTNECGWTLQMCDGSNNGIMGQVREQQIKFKAPHPLNLVAPHVMIELRSPPQRRSGYSAKDQTEPGYIEVNGTDADGIHTALDKWFTSQLQSSSVDADVSYCDKKYECKAFRQRGTEGENNMGALVVQVVDFMVQQSGWTLVTSNSGNYGRFGDMREAQLVFRQDAHVQRGAKHVLVEFRMSTSNHSISNGYIEMCGLRDVGSFGDELDEFVKGTWGCTDYRSVFGSDEEPLCDKKYSVPSEFYYSKKLTNNLGKRTMDLAKFAGSRGWALSLCNGGSREARQEETPVPVILREQQVMFTKCDDPSEAQRPLLMVEMRTQFAVRRYDQSLLDGFIEVSGPNTNGIHDRIASFVKTHMAGKSEKPVVYCDLLLSCGMFRQKESQSPASSWDGLLSGESNMGKWAMRFCDFMVDHIGEWELVTCGGASPEWVGVASREMQMVFRHRPGARAVFMSAAPDLLTPLGRPPLQPPPYWCEDACAGKVGHRVVAGSADELCWVQELLDGTFKAKVTRDRQGVLPSRLCAVSCLRSEQPSLWDRFAQRREALAGRWSEGAVAPPKTLAASSALAGRCSKGEAGESYLFHGTNPTSAVAILAASLAVTLAGKAVGTMFGPGVYLAEASSKSDEYARDDPSGDYAGLCALIICRAALGRPLVVTSAEDCSERVLSGEFDVVVGDREQSAGTYREFVFFHDSSIYPEYAVFYRRIHDTASGGVAPPSGMTAVPTV